MSKKESRKLREEKKVPLKSDFTLPDVVDYLNSHPEMLLREQNAYTAER